MGLYSGSVSYMRYKIDDSVPENIKDFVLEKLKTFSFREIDALSLKDQSIGWVSAENMASTFFDDLHFVKEPYLVFSLRMDERRIPPLAMKAALLREEMKYKRATGKERLSKKDKDMLNEEVRQLLLKKALPIPSLYDVCWNILTGIVLFFVTSKIANETLISFFYRSFNIKLTPLTPYNIAGFLRGKNNKYLKMNNSVFDFTSG